MLYSITVVRVESPCLVTVCFPPLNLRPTHGERLHCLGVQSVRIIRLFLLDLSKQSRSRSLSRVLRPHAPEAAEFLTLLLDVRWKWQRLSPKSDSVLNLSLSQAVTGLPPDRLSEKIATSRTQ